MNKKFHKAKLNFLLNDEQEKNLKTEIGCAVYKNFGYGEEYLLAIFEDNLKIYLRGEKNKKIVFIEISLFGNEKHIGYAEFFAEITKIFVEILSIPTKNIYIKFDDISVWGVSGKIFNRNDYK